MLGPCLVHAQSMLVHAVMLITRYKRQMHSSAPPLQHRAGAGCGAHSRKSENLHPFSGQRRAFGQAMTKAPARWAAKRSNAARERGIVSRNIVQMPVKRADGHRLKHSVPPVPRALLSHYPGLGVA